MAVVKAFVIFRDRVTYGRTCVQALQAAGLDVVIADHGTTCPEALDWLHGAGVPVIRCGGGHPRDLWTRPWLAAMCGTGRYVVTDPDTVPSGDCPPDWLDRLGAALDETRAPKAGLGLRLDRIPGSYPHRDRILAWESQFWQAPAGDGLFHAAVDTTLALHVPLSRQPGFTFTAVRTGAPYTADHLAWYEDYACLPPDVAWYHRHAEPGISCYAPNLEET